jgi:hypothetical protein
MMAEVPSRPTYSPWRSFPLGSTSPPRSRLQVVIRYRRKKVSLAYPLASFFFSLLASSRTGVEVAPLVDRTKPALAYYLPYLLLFDNINFYYLFICNKKK